MPDYVKQVLDLDRTDVGHARAQFDEALAEETTTVMVVMGTSEKAEKLRQLAKKACAQPSAHWRLINARDEDALADIAQDRPALSEYMSAASGVLAFSLPCESRRPCGVVRADVQADRLNKLTVLDSFAEADEYQEVR